MGDYFTNLKLGAGTQSDFSVSTDTNYTQGNFGARLNLYGRTAESHRDDIDHEQIGVNPYFTWQLTEATRLDVFVDYLSSEVTPDPGLPTLGPELAVDSRSKNFGLPTDNSEQELLRIGGSIEHKASETLTLRNKTYFNQLDWDSTGSIYAGFVAFGQGLEPAPRTLSRLNATLDDKQQLIGTEFEAVSSIEAGGMEHQVLTGLEFTRLTDEFTLNVDPATNIDVPTGFESPGFLPPLPPNVGDATADFIGLYAYDQVAIAPNSHVMLGGRVDFYDFKDDAKNIENDDTLFSPFGGAVVGIADGISIFGNAGIGFAPPSTESTNPSGDAEESTQYEGGLRFGGGEQAWYGQIALL